MEDRVSLYPGRVKMVPVAGQANVYDMVRMDEPQREGTPINKASLLKDATAGLYGLGTAAVPDDVLAKLGKAVLQPSSGAKLTNVKGTGITIPASQITGLPIEWEKAGERTLVRLNNAAMPNVIATKYEFVIIQFIGEYTYKSKVSGNSEYLGFMVGGSRNIDTATGWLSFRNPGYGKSRTETVNGRFLFHFVRRDGDTPWYAAGPYTLPADMITSTVDVFNTSYYSLESVNIVQTVWGGKFKL